MKFLESNFHIADLSLVFLHVWNYISTSQVPYFTILFPKGIVFSKERELILY